MRTQEVKLALVAYEDGAQPSITPVDEYGRIIVGGDILSAIKDAAESEDAAVVTGSVGYAPTNAEYETVAASQTDQACGATGATGDYLSHLIVVPATTSPGNVLIQDGANSAITVFTGGASSVSNLVPFTIYLNMVSTVGAWQITTGSNVSVIAVGNFT